MNREQLLKAVENEMYINPPAEYRKKILGQEMPCRKSGMKDRSQQKTDFLRLLRERKMEEIFKECCICGWREASIDLAHIIPNRKYGMYDLDNIVPLCPNHHRLLDHRRMSEIDTLRIKAFTASVKGRK